MAEISGISSTVKKDFSPGNNEVSGISAIINRFATGDNSVVLSSVQTPFYCFEILDEDSNPIPSANILPQTDFDGLYTSPINGTIGTTGQDGLGYVKINRGDAVISAAGYRTQTVVYDFSTLPLGDCITVQLVPVNSMASRAFTFGLPSTSEVNENDIDYCAFECEYIEKAFYSSSDDFWKKDKSSFLYQKTRQSDTINLELWRDGVKVDDITDNTYGEYFPSLSEFAVGFIADWTTIVNAQGNGLYQIVAQKNILGVDSEERSRTFRTMPYTDLTADKTVVLEWSQTGNIIRGFDYGQFQDGGWNQRIRFSGEFFRETPESEIDEYLDSNYNRLQIQDKVVNRYSLQTKLIANSIYLSLSQDAALANEIKVTDFNILNNEIYRRLPLRFAGFEDLSRFAFNRNYTFKLNFNDQFDDVRKRNF